MEIPNISPNPTSCLTGTVLEWLTPKQKKSTHDALDPVSKLKSKNSNSGTKADRGGRAHSITDREALNQKLKGKMVLLNCPTEFVYGRVANTRELAEGLAILYRLDRNQGKALMKWMAEKDGREKVYGIRYPGTEFEIPSMQVMRMILGKMERPANPFPLWKEATLGFLDNNYNVVGATIEGTGGRFSIEKEFYITLGNCRVRANITHTASITIKFASATKPPSGTTVSLDANGIAILAVQTINAIQSGVKASLEKISAELSISDTKLSLGFSLGAVTVLFDKVVKRFKVGRSEIQIHEKFEYKVNKVTLVACDGIPVNAEKLEKISVLGLMDIEYWKGELVQRLAISSAFAALIVIAILTAPVSIPLYLAFVSVQITDPNGPYYFNPRAGLRNYDMQ